MKRTIHRIMAVALSAMLAASAYTPTFAANAYNPVSGEKKTIDKYLVMKQDAEVPNRKFEFTISGDVEAQAATSSTAAIIPGKNADGTPVISAAEFKTGDEVYTTAQARTDNGTGILNTGNDTVSLEENEKYAKKTVDVDFTGVKFPEPGIYRFFISETTTDGSGITVDDKDGKYLDVYVEHDDEDEENKTLKVTEYILHNDNGTVKTDSSEQDGPAKESGFTNHYATQHILFGKQVSGSGGSRDQYFKFHVKITGGVAGDKYDIDLTDADAAISANPNSATTVITSNVTNPAFLTVGSDGTAESDFYLQHDQSILIKGITRGVSYEVTEDKEAYVSTDGATFIRNEQTITANDSSRGEVGNKDLTIGYTNTINGVTPTGVFMKTLKAVVAVIAGLAVAGYVLRKRGKTVVE